MTRFKGYTKETTEFLKNLEKNPNKEWFDANRSDYEKYILDINKAFVTEMGEHLQALAPTIKFIPKVGGSLFNIRRDTRFHKEKPTYKNYFGTFFWEGEGKRTLNAGFYFHYKIDRINAGAKIHYFDKRLLKGYREYIKDDVNAKALRNILDSLTENGFELPQKKYKRTPAGMDKNSPFAELYLYDRLYAQVEMPTPEWVYSETLIDELFKIFKTLLPFYEWMRGMMKSIPAEQD